MNSPDIETRINMTRAVGRYLRAVDRFEAATKEFNDACTSLRDQLEDSVSKKDAAGNVTIERILRTKPHPTYEAGDRTGRLPDVLPLDYDAFVSAFNSPARSQPAGNGSAATSSKPASTPIGKAKS